MKKYTIIMLASFCLCGCSTTNIAETVKALGDDHSTVMHTITTIYGTSKFIRVGAATNSTTSVSPDGTITIKVP